MATAQKVNATKEELTEMYKTMSLAQLAKHFGVTRSHIGNKISRLGIKKEPGLYNSNRNMSSWPDAEVLKELYKTKTSREIAAMFGKSESATEKKLSTIGARKSAEARAEMLRKAGEIARRLVVERMKRGDAPVVIETEKKPVTIICNVEPKIYKAESDDWRNIMSRPVYDPKEQPITWRY